MNKYDPRNVKRLYHFSCDLCGEEYVAEMSEAQIDGEALKNWGLSEAHRDPATRTICEECHKKIIAPITG